MVHAQSIEGCGNLIMVDHDLQLILLTELLNFKVFGVRNQGRQWKVFGAVESGEADPTDSTWENYSHTYLPGPESLPQPVQRLGGPPPPPPPLPPPPQYLASLNCLRPKSCRGILPRSSASPPGGAWLVPLQLFLPNFQNFLQYQLFHA
jgi:hypothetical protein